MAHSWQTFISPLGSNETVWSFVFGISARFAVIWFFCLSGYVMALSVKKNISRFGEFSGVEYFLARAFRILPPLTVVVVFVYALTKIAAFYDVEKLPEGVLSARAIYSVEDGLINSQPVGVESR